MITVSPTQQEVFTAIRSFLLPLLLPTTLPPSSAQVPVSVVQGQVNRVTVKEADYVVMWPLFNKRLAWNANDYLDCAFTASIAGTAMVVTAKDPDFAGSIQPGYSIFGPDVAAGTEVVSGPGGVGTYVVKPSQTVISEKMAAGTQTLLQNADLTVQLDVHGPRALDNIGILSSVFFDEVAFRFFEALDPPIDMRPLYLDDPRQMPFITDSQQYQDRYVVTAHFNVNETVRVPQQFADQLVVDLVNVDTLL